MAEKISITMTQGGVVEEQEPVDHYVFVGVNDGKSVLRTNIRDMGTLLFRLVESSAAILGLQAPSEKIQALEAQQKLMTMAISELQEKMDRVLPPTPGSKARG